MKKLLLFTLTFLVLFGCQNDNELKYLNKDLSVDERVDDLMKRMTLEEKVAQMTQFVGLNYDRTKRVGVRLPIPMKNLRAIQKRCVEIDDELRWLVALVPDTGMRLAESTGLLVEDIKLDVDIPFVSLKSHPWRPLKTDGSTRDIPLVGQSLWSAKRIKALSQSKFAFPRYNTASVTSTNTASATLNKWLKSEGYDNYTMHCFRHSLRDRLRNTNCPSDVADQIGGWSNKTVGQEYGSGYALRNLQEWMNLI